MTNKQIRRVGADGKLYFTYNLREEIKLLPPVGAPFTVRVLACEFDDDTETEYYRIESAGEELPARFSVQQLELLFAQFPHEESNAGEPEELPLLTEEVKAYYAAKRSELKKANVRENEKLKSTAWDSNQKAVKALKEKLCYTVSENDKEQTVLIGNKIKELEAEMERLLKAKGVDERILRKVPDCPLCYDTGFIVGKLCDCARRNEQKIKTFNALKRLVVSAPPKTRAVTI